MAERGPVNLISAHKSGVQGTKPPDGVWGGKAWGAFIPQVSPFFGRMGGDKKKL